MASQVPFGCGRPYASWEGAHQLVGVDPIMLAVVDCWDVAFVWHEVLVEYKGPEDIMLAL